MHTGIGKKVQKLKMYTSLQDLKFNLGIKITKHIITPQVSIIIDSQYTITIKTDFFHWMKIDLLVLL